MTKDLYKELGNEIVGFRGLLKSLRSALLPSRKREIDERLLKITRLAHRIGGVVEEVAVELKKGIDRLESGELDLYEVHQILEQVLKLEQEVREL